MDQTWQDTGGTPTVKDRYTYRYDYNSNRLYRKNELASSLSELYRANDTSGAGTTHYDGYDGLNRLAAFHRGVLNADGDGIASGLGRSEAFGLDGLGNWRTYGVDSDGNGTNDLDQTRVHNEVNEIDTTDDHGDAAGDAIAATTGSNWIDPVYDAAGNMTQGPQPQNPLVAGTGETVRLHYAYDAWNRMTGVRRDNAGNPGLIVYTYGYDGLHRRIRRSTASEPTWYYHNESWQVVEERDSQELPKVQYVWDVRYIDAAALRDRDGDGDGDCVDGDDERLYYCQDANFNVTSLVDAYDGVVVERYRYDPYGKPTVLNGVRDANSYATTEWQERTIYTFENELLYCGYRYDGGRAGHYHVRYRVYHPTLGRWGQRDPIGYKGSRNLLEYASGAPTLKMDAFGLEESDSWRNRPDGYPETYQAGLDARREAIKEDPFKDSAAWGGSDTSNIGAIEMDGEFKDAKLGSWVCVRVMSAQWHDGDKPRMGHEGNKPLVRTEQTLPLLYIKTTRITGYKLPGYEPIKSGCCVKCSGKVVRYLWMCGYKPLHWNHKVIATPWSNRWPFVYYNVVDDTETKIESELVSVHDCDATKSNDEAGREPEAQVVDRSGEVMTCKKEYKNRNLLIKAIRQ